MRCRAPPCRTTLPRSAGADGGGIYLDQNSLLNTGSDQTLTIQGGSGLVQGNGATGSGGGIYVSQGATLNFQGLNLDDSAIQSNSAGGNGGGVFVAQGGT